MKKFSMIFVAMVLTLLISANAFGGAKENYLLSRYEAGKNSETDDCFHKTFNVIENNSLENWALGSKFITGENGFIFIKPYVCYKFGDGFQIGAEYGTSSLDKECAGPKFRFVGPVGKFFVLFDVTQYFDLKDDKDTTDVYLNLKTMGLGWYYGAEIWYYNVNNGTENLHLRPIKIGYRFQNGLAPFVMCERHWNDEELKTDSFFMGLEIKF